MNITKSSSLSPAGERVGERAWPLLSMLCFIACAPSVVVPLEEAKYADALGVDIAASTKVAGMYIRDITVGAGPEALTGHPVTMRYTGWLSNGTQFDSNQTTGFQFTVGSGQVIQGWDVGVRGMLVGGERQLIIPASMGYGESGTSGIPGNSILVFNVTMMSTP